MPKIQNNETTKPKYRPLITKYTHDSTAVRNPVDDYPTPFGFVKTLVNRVNLDPERTHIHEPAAGGGHLVSHLRLLGFQKVSFEDLVFSNKDYLREDYTPPVADWVITNPPYKHGEAFIRKALTHADNVAVLMNSSFVEATGRARGLFREHPPRLILLNARRMRLRNGTSSVFAHHWLVWNRSYNGPTEFDWVLPEGDIQMPDGVAPGVWTD